MRKLRVETIETEFREAQGMRYIVLKPEVEQSSMKEIIGIVRLSDKSPPMMISLLEQLEYNGMAEVGDEILLGREICQNTGNEFIGAFIRKLKSVTVTLPDKSSPHHYGRLHRRG